ncbi:hypothetical protein Anas_11297 [Armadillidium nasatum]|uniref:Reverse transcriptase domain-containing protein n=1 Tax=Armadillidium nasatum TaxID=96803 RepID=A0A5N5TEB2_9CRUS|nr:hypothetical protein Anas_11297 [Armadillidium nasatum]
MNRDDLFNVINGILEWTPQQIYRGRISLIPKKNNPSLFRDYRSICILPLVVRVLYRMLAKRLTAVEHHAFQAGFVEGKGTSENIWLMDSILKSARTNKTSAYVALLDFKEAFDSFSSGFESTLGTKGLKASRIEPRQRMNNPTNMADGAWVYPFAADAKIVNFEKRSRWCALYQGLCVDYQKAYLDYLDDTNFG